MSHTDRPSNSGGSKVAQLIATTREEVKSREGGARTARVIGSSNGGNVASSGSSSSRTQPIGSVTKGQHNRTFFTNTPIFSMPPLATESIQRLEQQQQQQQQMQQSQKQLLFMKTSASNRIMYEQHAQQQQQQQQMRAGGMNQQSSIASMTYGGGDETLYSPDVPQLVPFSMTQQQQYHQPQYPQQQMHSPANLQGQPLPSSVFQTPYASFGVLPLAQTNPGGMQSARTFNNASTAYFTPMNTLPPPHHPPAGGQISPRMARTMGASLKSLTTSPSAAFPSPPSQPHPSPASNHLRVQLLSYFESPSCHLFINQLSVLGTELDSLLALSHNNLPETIEILKDLDQARMRFEKFKDVIDAVRTYKSNPKAVLGVSGSVKQLTADEKAHGKSNDNGANAHSHDEKTIDGVSTSLKSSSSTARLNRSSSNAKSQANLSKRQSQDEKSMKKSSSTASSARLQTQRSQKVLNSQQNGNNSNIHPHPSSSSSHTNSKTNLDDKRQKSIEWLREFISSPLVTEQKEAEENEFSGGSHSSRVNDSSYNQHQLERSASSSSINPSSSTTKSPPTGYEQKLLLSFLNFKRGQLFPPLNESSDGHGEASPSPVAPPDAPSSSSSSTTSDPFAASCIPPFTDASVITLLQSSSLPARRFYEILTRIYKEEMIFKTAEELVEEVKKRKMWKPNQQGGEKKKVVEKKVVEKVETDVLESTTSDSSSSSDSTAASSSTTTSHPSGDVPSVTGPFYSDGTLPLDAEDGVAGRFVVDDPNVLYGDGEDPNGVAGFACGPAVVVSEGTASTDDEPITSSKPGKSSSPSLGRITISRPVSASAASRRLTPDIFQDPSETEANDLAKEKEREKLIEYLEERCQLFKDLALSGKDLEVTQDDLDQCIQIGGGHAAQVLIELKCMDAIGKQFYSFSELISALKHSIDQTKNIERKASLYRHPDEASDSEENDGSRDVDGDEEEDNAEDSGHHTKMLRTVSSSDNNNSLPDSVLNASVTTSRPVLVMHNSSSRLGSPQGSPRGSPRMNSGGGNNGLGGTASAQSMEQSKKRLEKSKVMAEMMIKGEETPDGKKYTQEDYDTLRTALSSSKILLNDDAEPVELTQLLLIGNGLNHTLTHIKRFASVKRTLSTIQALILAIEDVKLYGVYSDTSDMLVLDSYLSSPDSMNYLKAYLASTSIPIGMKDLPQQELDGYMRECGGVEGVKKLLDVLVKENKERAGMTISSASSSAMAQPSTSQSVSTGSSGPSYDPETGLKLEPVFLIPHSPAELKEMISSLQKLQNNQTQHELTHAWKQVHSVLQDFLLSKSCLLFLPGLVKEKKMCTEEQAKRMVEGWNRKLVVATDGNASSAQPIKPTEQDVQTTIDHLVRFDAVGRKFVSVAAVVQACCVVSGYTPTSLPVSTESSSTGDNIPLTFTSSSQRSKLRSYLTDAEVEPCGLLNINPGGQFDALSSSELDQFMICLTKTARMKNAGPLKLSGGSKRKSGTATTSVLPRYITPLYRLQQRSVTGGEEYKSVSDIIRGLEMMQIEQPVAKEQVAEVIKVLEKEMPDGDGIVAEAKVSAVPTGGIFSSLSPNQSLTIDPTEIEDMILLFQRDTSRLSNTLQKLHSCGVKCTSISQLTRKLQRTLLYGFYSGVKDRMMLEEYFSHAERNQVLDVGVSASSSSSQHIHLTWSESDYDSLLQHSHGGGSSFLIENVFPRIATAEEYKNKKKATGLKELVERVELVLSKPIPVAKVVVEEAKTEEEQKKVEPAVADATPVTTPAVNQESRRSSITTAAATPLPPTAPHSRAASLLQQESQQQLQQPAPPPQISRASSLLIAANVPLPISRVASIAQPTMNPPTAISRTSSIATATATPAVISRTGSIAAAASPAAAISRADSNVTTVTPVAATTSGASSSTTTPAAVSRTLSTAAVTPAAISRVASIPSQQSATQRVVALIQNPISSSTTPLPPSYALIPSSHLSALSESVIELWVLECDDSIDTLLAHLSTLISLHRVFSSSADLQQALHELIQTGLGVSGEVKQSLLDYINEPDTHLFDAKSEAGSSTRSSGTNEKIKSIITNLTNNEITQLFTAGGGIQNLLSRLIYLDTIGSRFNTIAEIIAALPSLHSFYQPSEDDRTLLVEYFGSPECTLFEIQDSDQTMEISSSEVDAMIMCRGGIQGCLTALKALESEHWKVVRLEQLLNLLLGRDGHNAKKYVASQPAAPTPAAALASPRHPVVPSKTPASYLSHNHAMSIMSADGLATPPTEYRSPTSSMPLEWRPPSTTTHDAEQTSQAHQMILEYLSGENITLFAPLAETGAELEITDLELDHMIASTDYDVRLTLDVLQELDRQQRGFTSLATLAEAVKVEYPLWKARATPLSHAAASPVPISSPISRVEL